MSPNRLNNSGLQVYPNIHQFCDLNSIRFISFVRIIIIIIIIKYLYSANILKVQKRFTEVTLKILKTLLKKINIKIVKKLQKKKKKLQPNSLLRGGCTITRTISNRLDSNESVLIQWKETL